MEWDFKDNRGRASENGLIGGTVRVKDAVATFRFVGAQPGRWRVSAVDANGASGPKSEWREFWYTQ